MKLLFISNIAGETAVGSFSKAAVLAARQLGIEFHLAENFNRTSLEARKKDEEAFGIKTHHIDFYRAPYDLRNVRAYRQIVALIRKEKIEVIHCNTPIGGIVGRLAGKKCGVKTIIYQAHGFHFFRGAPVVNWLVYYPIERWLAHYTDALVTINQEDFGCAQSFRLRNHGKAYYIPGVGINLVDFEDIKVDRNAKRAELDLKNTDVVCISAGDLVPRKNYGVAIESIAKANNLALHYLICGVGPERAQLERKARALGIAEQIHFLGYRTDIKELLTLSNIFLFTTLQEGLPRSLMEAMACGLPCVTSKIRGNIDLIEEGRGGFLCNPKDSSAFADALGVLLNDPERNAKLGNYNRDRIKDYDIHIVVEKMREIYDNQIQRSKV